MSQDNSYQEDIVATMSQHMSGKRKFFARVLLSTIIIFSGLGGWLALRMLKEPPTPAEIPPPQLKVEVKAVCPETVPVTIYGYGEVKSLDSIALTPKVAGEIVYVHPDLEVGNVIPEGELLYRIDQRDYLAAKKQAVAQVDRLELTIKLLKRQFEQVKTRMETARRTRDIALEEFERDVELLEKKDVGSRSMVNMTELNYQKAHDAFEQVEQAIELFPMRIQEAEIGLEAAKAALEMASLSFERTEEFAPFNARIQHKQIELGQAVAPGMIALMLANDTVLEMSVPIDSRDARLWLPFVSQDEADTSNWFRELNPVECKIKWTEEPEDCQWTGTLHRVERFDPTTRTVTVAIRILNKKDGVPASGLPLVEGMYCSVEIPGTSVPDIFRLPRWAVSFDGFTYIAEGDRLKRRAVNVVRTQGEESYVDEGLSPGELVVVTRLVDPLPGILLEYEKPEKIDCEPEEQQ